MYMSSDIVRCLSSHWHSFLKRQIVDDNFIGASDVAEIARTLGISRATISKIITRGIAFLQKTIVKKRKKQAKRDSRITNT